MPSEEYEGFKRMDTGGVPRFVSKGVIEAKAKANAIIEKAKLNEAIRVIQRLEAEVKVMTISPRFSQTKRPSDSVYNIDAMNPNLVELTEAEYKRATLLMALEQIKNKILSSVGDLEIMVLDIEATKQ